MMLNPSLYVTSLILIGSASRIFMKLQTIPMYNYPLVVNLLVNLRNFVFLGTIGMIYVHVKYGHGIRNNNNANGSNNDNVIGVWGILTNRSRVIIAIGFLDALSMLLTIFSNTYLPGNLVILLTQAVIPVSLVCDRVLRRQTGHDNRKYIGAMLITFGIITAIGFLSETDNACLVSASASEDEYCLACQDYDSEELCNNAPVNATIANNTIVPVCVWEQDSATSDRELGWAFGLIMVSVSIYISTLLKVTLFDGPNAIYEIENRVSIFVITTKWQFIFAILLTPIFGMLQDPVLDIDDLMDNLSDGWDCFVGEGSIEDTCFPDDECSDTSQTYVNLFLVFNTLNNLLTGTALRTSDADFTEILWFSMSLMIPICSLIYTIPGFPDEQSPSYDKFLTVLLVAGGTIVYRKGNTWEKLWERLRNDDSGSNLVEPLLSVSNRDVPTAQTEESRKRETAIMFLS